MSEDVLHFHCQACQAKLTVPAKLAGIEGPCPKCGATIRAPEATPPTPAEPEYAPPPAQAPAPAPEEPPAPVAEAPATCRRPDSLPERRNPPPQATEQASIRPQPRELPDRPSRQAVSPKHSTADVAKRPAPRAQRSGSSSRSSSGIGRFLIPITFLFIGGALAYVLLFFFMGGPGSKPDNPEPPPTTDNPTNPPAPGPNPPSSTGATAGTSTPPPPPAPEMLDPAEGIEAQDVLRDFLRASSLGARLPYIEPAYEREALEGSIIDTPLLSADRITPDPPSRNLLENFVDHPFRVLFELDDESSVATLVVVRKRSDQKPKILIDPLLDLLGGRIADFAVQPTDGTRTFRAVIEAMPRCFEENIPNPDDKITYKISTSTHGGEIARAYASKLSPLAEMLYSPDSELRWGKRIPATITLKWTTEVAKSPVTAPPAPPEEADSSDTAGGEGEAASSEEDAPAPVEVPAPEPAAAMPYLELIEIKSLDWSP